VRARYSALTGRLLLATLVFGIVLAPPAVAADPTTFTPQQGLASP
jgi:hypothetical protein